MTIPQITNCLICQSPLGHDSKSQGYPTCLKHRHCTICKKQINPVELSLIVTPELVLEMADATELLCHSRCHTSESVSSSVITGRDLLLCNIARLLLEPNMGCKLETNIESAQLLVTQFLHEKEHLETFMVLRVMEGCVARISSIVAKKDNTKIKAQLEEVRKERVEAAKPAKSTTNEKLPPTHMYGIPMSKWNSLTTVDQHRIKAQEKNIDRLTKAGFNREQALEFMHTGDLITSQMREDKLGGSVQ